MKMKLFITILCGLLLSTMLSPVAFALQAEEIQTLENKPESPLVEIEPSLSNFSCVNPYPSGRFTDIDISAWYYPSVKTAYEFGLVKGFSDTIFNPSGNITLAESVALASRLHSIYYTGNAKFTQGNPWYQVYVDYAAKNGIISATAFSDYNAKATRMQFVSILAHALPAEAFAAINQIPDGAIPDIPSDSQNATDIYNLYRAGILTGNDDCGTFNPNSNIQRSEVAAIVTRTADTARRKNFTLKEKPSVSLSLDDFCGFYEATDYPATVVVWKSSNQNVAYAQVWVKNAFGNSQCECTAASLLDNALQLEFKSEGTMRLENNGDNSVLTFTEDSGFIRKGESFPLRKTIPQLGDYAGNYSAEVYDGGSIVLVGSLSIIDTGAFIWDHSTGVITGVCNYSEELDNLGHLHKWIDFYGDNGKHWTAKVSSDSEGQWMYAERADDDSFLEGWFEFQKQ